MSESRSKEIRFWWPIPLAALIWLVLIWEFGYFLKSPKEEIVSLPPIDARFVELPDPKPEQESSTPKSSSQIEPPKPEPKLEPKPKPEPEPKHEPPPSPQPRPIEPEIPIKPLPEKTVTETEVPLAIPQLHIQRLPPIWQAILMPPEHAVRQPRFLMNEKIQKPCLTHASFQLTKKDG